MKKKAAALRYDQKQNSAPLLVAKGKGKIAEAIVQKAVAFDVPLFANRELVDLLVDLDIDKEIPEVLYKSVAELFVWLAKQEKRLAR